MSRLLAFGYHDQTAPRHWTISRTMLAEGIELVECHTTARGLFGKLRDLFAKERALRRKADGILVTFPGHALVPFAWLLTRFPRRKLVFDAFIALHDTAVHDRKLLSPWHPSAWGLFLLDWLSCRLADEVLVDTEEHKKFFVRRYGLRPAKVRVIYLGARTDLFKPGIQKSTQDSRLRTHNFNILFIGTFIPLQGIEHILGAAKILQKALPAARFTFVGKGQTEQAMKALAKKWELRNVRFELPVPYQALPDKIRDADLCLGIFGTSDKARRVIPHKVYDAVACGVPVVTADTPGIREKFANHPLVRLCRAGDTEDLARTIIAAREAQGR